VMENGTLKFSFASAGNTSGRLKGGSSRLSSDESCACSVCARSFPEKTDGVARIPMPKLARNLRLPKKTEGEVIFELGIFCLNFMPIQAPTKELLRDVFMHFSGGRDGTCLCRVNSVH